MFDILKKKGVLAGEVLLLGLPPHKMYSVTVTFFSVGSASSPPPFYGDPPTDTWTDTTSVKEAEEPDDKPLRFRCERLAGYYFLGVSVIAFLERDGKMFAQVERFFPMSQPCEIRPGGERHVQLPVSWPVTPFDELHTYGTVHPTR
jgi:hypothetical protein